MNSTEESSPDTPDIFEMFLDELLRNPAYVGAFLLTLDLNKIEAEYQEWDQLMIFRKKFDRFGIVEWFELNPMYADRVRAPRQQFGPEEIAAGLDLIEASREGVTMMLKVNQIEAMMLEGVDPERVGSMLPPIRRKFDEHGLPTDFALGLNVVVT